MNPPKNLSKAAKVWWNKIESQWALSDSEYILLQSALEAWDEANVSKANIAKYGAVLKGKNGVLKKNPEIEVLKIARSHFLAGWRQLNFQNDPPGQPGRKPERIGYEDEND